MQYELKQAMQVQIVKLKIILKAIIKITQLNLSILFYFVKLKLNEYMKQNV